MILLDAEDEIVAVSDVGALDALDAEDDIVAASDEGALEPLEDT
jgi:hypothetical protein